MKDMKTNSMIKKMVFIIIAMCVGFTVEASRTLVYSFEVTDHNGADVADATITATSTNTQIAVVDLGRGDYKTDEVGVGYVYVELLGRTGTVTITVNFRSGRAFGEKSITLTCLENGEYTSSPEVRFTIPITLSAPVSTLFENNYFMNLRMWAIKEE